MSFEGTILNGTVVRDEPLALPEGTRVNLLVEAPANAASISGQCSYVMPVRRKGCHRMLRSSTITTCMGRQNDDDHLRGHVLFRGLEQSSRCAPRSRCCLDQIVLGQFVTTDWVLSEFANHMCDPQNRQEFVETLHDLQSSDKVDIVPADAALWRGGVALYSARPDKGWSLTDCISFVVMERESLTEA